MILTLFTEFSETAFWAALLLGVALALGVLLLLTRPKKRPGEAKISPRYDTPDSLPVNEDDPDLVEASAVHKAIADLMISDEWVELADKIAGWEAELASTPGGIRYHDVATDVALSGLQSLIDDVQHQSLDELKPAEYELGHFVDTQVGSPDHPVLACLAARAHMMLGYAYRAEFWPDEFQKECWRKTAQHFIAAGELLEQFDPIEHVSPLIAEAQYLQAQGTPGGLERLRDLFEAWIELDPSNPAIYSVHVPHLLPDRMGSETELREGAEAALERTEATLGYAGYAFFFLPILTERPELGHLLDAEQFATGFLDLAERAESQAEVNWAAATLAQAQEGASGEAAMAMQDTFCMIVSRHLKVIYPRIWPFDLAEVETRVEAATTALFDLDGLDTDTRFAAAA